jgi:hypothetical protein
MGYGRWLLLVAMCAGTGVGTQALSREARRVVPDVRAMMHGIGAVREADVSAWVFFSSSGVPPRGANADGTWPHDIYVSRWGGGDAGLEPPALFIEKPEAQEPVSVAQTEDGHIMLSFEDGWNAPHKVTQRYGVYDTALEPVAAYPMDVEDGGHSGHVAAVGNRFVVFYSKGWVHEGGVGGLGTGNGVYAAIYTSRGELLKKMDVAADKREWWPLAAGSERKALLLWQQFVPGENFGRLMRAVLDAQTGDISATEVLQPELMYYHYAVAYAPELGRFVVTGNDAKGRGFALLLDLHGEVTGRLDCMPAMVREAGIVVDGRKLYVPAQGDRLLALGLHEDGVTLDAVMDSPLHWESLGSTGLIRKAGEARWVSLTARGVEEALFETQDARPATDAEACAP